MLIDIKVKNKIIDCITFFNENLQFELRFNILKNFVSSFLICESIYDHRGNKKPITFLKNRYKKYEDKIKHIILYDKFPSNNNPWNNQAIQRDYIQNHLREFDKDDLIMFSDPDEIPNPNILKNLILKKKYGIFMMDCFNYKFNLFNSYESPWEGTRVVKKKDLKSIDFMRQKVKAKNLKYNFLRFDKERNIEIFENGGWHFNNIMSPSEISLKLRTFAHTEYSDIKFSSIDVIKKKIKDRVDLFDRGHLYKVVDLHNKFPKDIVDNLIKFKEHII